MLVFTSNEVGWPLRLYLPEFLSNCLGKLCHLRCYLEMDASIWSGKTWDYDILLKPHTSYFRGILHLSIVYLLFRRWKSSKAMRLVHKSFRFLEILKTSFPEPRITRLDFRPNSIFPGWVRSRAFLACCVRQLRLDTSDQSAVIFCFKFANVRKTFLLQVVAVYGFARTKTISTLSSRLCSEIMGPKIT